MHQDTYIQIHEAVWTKVEHLWQPNFIFGHGTDHAKRAYEIGMQLCESEKANPLPVGVSCYLMDAGLDIKHGREGHIERGLAIAHSVIAEFSELLPFQELILNSILHHDADHDLPIDAPTEMMIVRDSDTLDRMGYPGVRMTLTYGIWIDRPLYSPNDPVCNHRIPDLNGYSLDYIKYLCNLFQFLSTPSAKLLGKRKLYEINSFLMGFEENLLLHPMTYAKAFDLVERLSKE